MRIFCLCVGWIAVALAIIGIALPVMPTVPFLLVAVWAFARSSPRLRRRILRHPTYGPSIRAWQDHGAVGRWAKIWAVSAMAGGVMLALIIGIPVWVVAIQFGICTAIGTYVVTRPEA